LLTLLVLALMAHLFVLGLTSMFAFAASQSYVGFEFKPEGPPLEYRITEGVSKPYTIRSQTYYSQGFALKPGQMLFSNPYKTVIPVPGNGTKVFITGMVGDIVKDGLQGKEAAALSEIYDHHYIMKDAAHKNKLCPTGPNYMFGIGSESRNSPVHFPKAHGYLVQANDSWGANIHLLRTDSGKYLQGDDPHAAVQQCNECFYAPNKGAGCSPDKNGTFACCGENCFDGSCFCPTTAAAKKVPANTYYLRYTVNFTTDLDAITPVDVGVYTTPSCKTFYAVYENDEQPESLSSTTFTIPADSELMLAIGHQHVGARNISLHHNGKAVCASVARYGTEEGVPGNEKGYVVEFPPCYNADDNQGQGFKVKKGDTLRVDSWYWVGRNDKMIAPHPGGTHLNVMGYMYMAYKVAPGGEWPEPDKGEAPTAGCMGALQKYCGSSVGFTDECLKCAEGSKQHLAEAKCTKGMVEHVCEFMASDGGQMDGQTRRTVPTTLV